MKSLVACEKVHGTCRDKAVMPPPPIIGMWEESVSFTYFYPDWKWSSPSKKNNLSASLLLFFFFWKNKTLEFKANQYCNTLMYEKPFELKKKKRNACTSLGENIECHLNSLEHWDSCHLYHQSPFPQVWDCIFVTAITNVILQCEQR